MRKYRKESEIFADVLKAVSDEHFCKSGVIKAANLNNYYADRYLKFA